MEKPLVLSVVAFVAVITVAAALFWLTYEGDQGANGSDANACANTKQDIGAAVLADGEGDQDALVNRAIIVRGKCEQDEQD